MPPSEARWPADELATDSRWVFGTPSPRDGELAWVQHCYAYLRPRGVAVIAVPARACVQPSGAQVRAQLVRSGVLREVIALPTGLAPDGGRCLWVLERPRAAPDLAPVRMADVSALGDPAEVPREFSGWQRLFESAGPSIVRAVPRVEMLDVDTNLLPSRYLATGPEASADDLAQVTDRLRALYAWVGQGLRAPSAPKVPSRHSFVTVGELERVGALTIRTRDTTPRAGDLLLRTLGRPPAVATGTDADDAGVAQVVEVDPARLDAHFVATFLRTDARAVPLTNTLGALSRDDLRKCRIPRIPLPEQRRYGDDFRRLDDLRGVLTALAVASANVIDQTVHGLTAGTLAPTRSATPTEGEQL